MTVNDAAWPELPPAAWHDTAATLHRWLQIVGKIRMVSTPPINHSWHVTLYVSARGLTTSAVPGVDSAFEIEFNFINHELIVRCSSGETRSMPLRARSVADFYGELQALLASLAIEARIHARPNEVADAVPFADDEAHASYDPEFANRYWRILVSTDRVFRQFRSSFIGKCSPVHFFWGAPDLAVTRFSGRTAPPHPGGVPNLPDAVAQEAYSHEVSSAGFWHGGPPIDYAAFYSYAYPEPPGYAHATVQPAAAFYSADLREFLLPYDAVRTAPSPDAALTEFLESTYAAAADLGGWDRQALERATS